MYAFDPIKISFFGENTKGEPNEPCDDLTIYGGDHSNQDPHTASIHKNLPDIDSSVFDNRFLVLVIMVHGNKKRTRTDIRTDACYLYGRRSGTPFFF